MASIIEGYTYDIFISYRQNDNKYDGWVTEFVDNLNKELEANIKDKVSVYFDINPHDGLLETHSVDQSLKDKLKCLIFIPIISRTYCDPKSFAWQHEFVTFNKLAKEDQFGRDIKLAGGNVASRILPVKIHDLDSEDQKMLENELGGVLRGIEFIYKSAGVNRPLRANEDHPQDNINKTYYRDQINKVSLAVKEIIKSIKNPVSVDQVIEEKIEPEIEEQVEREKAPEVKKHNLPNSTTSFIGREKEMKEVRDLFHKSRIVTLTGAGGCGKTRLAREIAFMLVEEYKDGVWFIDLSPISDPNFVSKAISDVLSIKEEPDKPIVDTLIESIKEKSLLILLDNCEHLIQECAEIVHKLLNTVKGIRILATSREALNIEGEVVWRIPLMAFPPGSDSIKDIKEINQYEAIRLFVDRAGSSQPGFSLNPQNVSSVTQICQRIEGIPLAIELAATRIRHIGLETILERLEDHFKVLSSSSRVAPDRQQTLKAAIDWSYELLSEQEQLLFRRVSVFAGDFSIEAVEEVCSDTELKEENILTLLSLLVDKSLVIAENQEDGSVRYKCLIPLHQYSLQKLIETGEEEKLRKLHLLYNLKIAEEAYEEQFESQSKWLIKLENEHDNLIAALNWSDKHSPEEFIRLTGDLAWYWRMHSHLQFGNDYLEKALSKAVDINEAYARCLMGLAIILNHLKHASDNRIIDLMTKSLSIFRKYKNHRDEAWVLSEISEINGMRGNYEISLKYSEQSLEIARSVGNPGLINHCLSIFCEGFVSSKQYYRGKPVIEELLISSENLGHIYGVLMAKHFLGDCAQGTGNFKEAEVLYAQCAEEALKFNFVLSSFVNIQGVAIALSGQSRWAKSIRLDVAARKKGKTLGVSLDGLTPFWDEWIDLFLGGARKEMGEELTRKYEIEGNNLGFEAALKYALDFDKD
jgi:non-specific serine/threonine protein kinase